MLVQTQEPIADYAYAKELLKSWFEEVDPDTDIVFSWKTEAELIEDKVEKKELTAQEGLPEPARR
eukprot:8298761-Heterocapsa_arctica.AAC.1